MRLNLFNSALKVCVDEIANGQIKGSVYGQRLEKPYQFTDMANFLIQTEELLDRQGYPRAYQRKRSFRGTTEEAHYAAEELEGNFMNEKQVNAARGKQATFLIKVLTRQNTDWQGEINWLDDTPVAPFASALEMMRIVDRKLIKGGADVEA